MDDILQGLQQFLHQHTILAPFLYVMLHMLLAVCIIPCSPMAVIAGVVWGKYLGLVLSIAAAVIASSTTFALSRVFLRNKIYSFCNKRYSKTDWFLAQTQQHGWKFVAAVQLNPMAPASTLGYLFGLTSIEFLVYAKYLILFMLPLQLLLVVIGDSLPKLGESLALLSAGIFCALAIYALLKLKYRNFN